MKKIEHNPEKTLSEKLSVFGAIALLACIIYVLMVYGV